MLSFFWSAFQILSLVTGHPVDSGRYVIDSQPLLFSEEPDSDSQVIHSTLVLKKKENTGGPVYYTEQIKDEIINNHHIDAEGVVWKRPYRPVSQVFSNHKGTVSRKKWTTSTTEIPFITTQPQRPVDVKPGKTQTIQKVISNHNPSTPVRSRPHRPSSVVSVVDPPTSLPTDIIGDRVKLPDTIKSATINVLDAPSHVKTTLKHNKIIVAQKRLDQRPVTSDKKGTTTTTFRPTEMGNFSVAPVMDVWSNVPIPSKPTWASSSTPVKGGISRPQTVVPNIPFMPFLTSILTPLINKPLTPSTVNSGMHGIKAMQGFLRNSLMGAMFCFLPSAFIALSLTATQRAQIRQIPEVDDMMVFCKKCLENLTEAKAANSKELTWMDDAFIRKANE